MKRLGLSIYPEKSTLVEIKSYLKDASELGFSRVFSCLLSVNKPAEEIKKEFTEINTYAHELNYEVIVDVSPRVFGELNISYKDLSFFKEIGADGIRLDAGFSGLEESIMTYNPEGLIVEINMSNNVHTIDTIMDYRPNKYKLYGCHNFYPHRYTGLSVQHFLNTSKRYKDLGLRTAAFVNSKVATTGPWPVEEGLCPLEMHREWEITSAAKWLWATELIDDVIVANSFASEEELKALSEIDPYLLTLDCELSADDSEIERHIVQEEPHLVRGDSSDYVLRSSQSRITHKKDHFEPHDTRPIEKGDILIDNYLYTKYAGELQVALLPMENSGKTNVVGRVLEQDLPLLDLLKPWQKFQFSVKDKK